MMNCGYSNDMFMFNTAERIVLCSWK